MTVRRGGTLEDPQHRLFAAWAVDCAEHVLEYFCLQYPDAARPRRAVEQARAWSRGEISMTLARKAAYAAHDAAKAATGAAAYAIRAVRAASPVNARDKAGRIECKWQRERLPKAIRALVLSDQDLRNHKFWSLFQC